jgi:hypothetical protein
MVPKRRQTTYWRRGNTQKNIYSTSKYISIVASKQNTMIQSKFIDSTKELP